MHELTEPWEFGFTEQPQRVRIEVGSMAEIAPAIVASMEKLSERLVFTQQALAQTIQFVAGLAASGNRESETTIETLRALVAATESLQAAATAQVSAANAQAAQAPETETKKTVTFVRDYSGRIEGAEIKEVTDR